MVKFKQIMAQYINKDALVAEIIHKIKVLEAFIKNFNGVSDKVEKAKNKIEALNDELLFIESLEVKEIDLYNNGWIDCSKQMPKETKQTSDTLQGHHEWTESELVLVWNSIYGASVDSTRNGKWRSEQKSGCTGQIIHGIIAWRPIPEFNEEL